MAMERKADRIADDLLARIVSGEIPVGSVLPKESELAGRYRANRSVVREAVKKLEVHRLVRPVRRKGTVVLDPLASLSPEVLRAMLAPGDRRVDRAMMANLLELRAHLDALMNALAAERRSEEDLARMEACFQRIESSRARPRQFSAAIDELGLAVARATANPIFEMLVHWHRHIFADLDDLLMLVRRPSDAHIQGIRTLIDGIRRRDAAFVRDLTRQYHEWATRVLLDAVSDGKEASGWTA